jgi:MFS family permease
VLRACWSVGLAFVFSGSGGLALVIAVQFGLVTCMGVFNPVLAAYRLEQTPADRVARTLAAWSVTSSAAIAGMTALWGALAAVIGPRMAIAVAGVLMLATPFLLPRRADASAPDREPAQPEHAARLFAPADG